MKKNHLISVDIPRDVAQNLLDQLSTGKRGEVKLSLNDANKWLGALTDAINNDDA